MPQSSQFRSCPLLLVYGGLLVLAVGITVWAAMRERQPGQWQPLASRLPLTIEGWVGTDVPLGDAEVMNASSRLLNFDDYIFRVYRRGTEEVFVYAMYWRQGSISVREIAGHTPDGCWTANGAVIKGPRMTRRYRIEARLTAAAEVREFALPGDRSVQALWWHIWGDAIVDRGFDSKTILPTLKELWVWLGKRHGRRREQLFVRIHTTGDLGAAMKTEPVKAFVNVFGEVFEAQPLSDL